MDAKRLDTVPLFATLSKSDRRLLAGWADEVVVPSGKAITQQGALAYEFMVIMDGSAEVLVDGQRVSDLGPGDLVGEIGLLASDRRRRASVVTTAPTTVVVVTGAQFRAMVRDMPKIAGEVRRVIAERVGDVD